MDNEQKKIDQIQSTFSHPWDKYMGVNSGTYNLTAAATAHASPTYQIVPPRTTEVVCPAGHDLLNQIRAVVREELQREQSHDRSGTVHICIDGQWYQGDLYPTDEEAHG